MFIWENFHPDYLDLRRENRDLGNRASLASHMNTWQLLRRKEWRDEISETEPDPKDPKLIQVGQLISLLEKFEYLLSIDNFSYLSFFLGLDQNSLPYYPAIIPDECTFKSDDCFSSEKVLTLDGGS